MTAHTSEIVSGLNELLHVRSPGGLLVHRKACDVLAILINNTIVGVHGQPLNNSSGNSHFLSYLRWLHISFFDETLAL